MTAQNSRRATAGALAPTAALTHLPAGPSAARRCLAGLAAAGAASNARVHPVGGFVGRETGRPMGAARDGPERLNMNAQTDNSLSHRRTTRVQPRQDVGRRQNIAPPASSSVSVASFAAPPGDLRARNGLSAPPDAAMEATTAETPARWVSLTGRTVPGPRSAAWFAFYVKKRITLARAENDWTSQLKRKTTTFAGRCGLKW